MKKIVQKIGYGGASLNCGSKIEIFKKNFSFQKTFCIIKKKSCTDIEGMNKLRI